MRPITFQQYLIEQREPVQVTRYREDEFVASYHCPILGRSYYSAPRSTLISAVEDLEETLAVQIIATNNYGGILFEVRRDPADFTLFLLYANARCIESGFDTPDEAIHFSFGTGVRCTK